MILTVFRSRVKPDAEEEYKSWATRLAETARRMPGYIAHKGFVAEDGERVTIVEFHSAEAQRAWSLHPEHVQAKKKGRADFYLEYRVIICSVERDSRFPPTPGTAQAACR